MNIYQFPSQEAEEKLNQIISRDIGYLKKDFQTVSQIIDQVRNQGDTALVEFTRQFDSPVITQDTLQVSASEMEAAAQQVDPSFIQALNRAARHIEKFHKQQRPKSWIDTQRPGTLLGQLVTPVDSAGIYVPGGKGGNTPLVSSVLMGAIPAKIAGVGRIVMATPPRPDGSINPHLLYAAQQVGIDAIYKVGSAWAIAAFAYGTQTVTKTNVIVGPGNIFVTIAKKIVEGTVGIDMIAGPSEVLVIADQSAEPAFAAADLLSQAEHDSLSSAILVTDSAETAQAVSKAVDSQMASLARKEIAQSAMEKFGAIFVVENLSQAFELANQIAPEHLELQIQEPFAHISRIRNAGAVFVGPYTPEPVGDYIAGPNHVLPTAGTARFSSALSVDHFIKKTSLVHYAKDTFMQEAKDIITLADIEGLGAHANAIRIRLKD
jgi:histidinol dehydrogenase